MGKGVHILKENRRVRPDNSEVERLMCDNSKARELLGWQPEITLREGLERTIEWFTEHADEYRESFAV